MFKRSRQSKTPKDEWDEFVEDVRGRSNEEYPAIVSLESTYLPTALQFTMATGNRIPTTMVCTLCGDTYCTTAWVVHNSNTLTVHVVCSTTETLKKPKTNNNSDKKEVICVIPKELQNQLYFKNKDTFVHLETSLQEVCNSYHEEMEWGDTHPQPYEIIYHKKHHQIITRFKFSIHNPSIKMLTMPFPMAIPWIEYAQKQDTFWLVMILKECL